MNRYIFPFEKLDAWQIAVDLAEAILGFLEELSPNKHLRLIGQMEAAATSPAQNIAGGEGWQNKKEFIQFLHIAKGFIFEVVTLNIIFRRRRLFSEEQTNEIRNDCEASGRKLDGLINSLHGKRANARV